MLSHRQRLIQLADRSELGWRVVQEYKTNPLAEDSEDEKRMYKAEAQATRKLKVERSKKAKSNRIWQYKRGNGSQGQSAIGVQTSTASVQKPVLCFQCRKPGHWRQECPGNASNNKISIGNSVIFKVYFKGFMIPTLKMDNLSVKLKLWITSEMMILRKAASHLLM